MNFEFICIYNPEYGTEENVDPQLIFTTPEGPDYIKLIGIAQGIAELSYSFGDTPVKWFKTGRKHQSRLVLVVPLYSENPSNWRSGFWFAGQLSPNTPGSPSPAVAHRLVQLSFQQHMLQHGKPPRDGAGPNASYWETFASSSFSYGLPYIVAPQSIQVAAGLLNPHSKEGIEKIRREHGLVDVMVTTIGDSSAVYLGSELGLPTRMNIQRWLERNLAEKFTSRVQEDSATKDDSSVEASSSHTKHDDQVNEEETTPAAKPAPVEENKPRESEKSSWFTLKSYIPDFSGLQQPWLANYVPSMSQLSMASLQYLPSMSMGEWWSSQPKNNVIPDGLIVSNANLYDMDSFESIYVSVWRHALFNYLIVSKEPIEWQETEKLGIFGALCSQLEGFSFAFEPPSRFYYLIQDSQKSTIISTFPSNFASKDEITRNLVSSADNSTQKVVRLGSTWLYFVSLTPDVHAVFGKKNVTSQQSTLLGALHSDVQLWIDEYKRKYI